MTQIKHNHNCKHFGENYQYDWSSDEKRDDIVCNAYNFQEWLPHIAPDFFWFNIQEQGTYEGSVYGVARYNNQFAIYEDSYGSCGGCGAWGEGGEPTTQDEVISRCNLFDTKDKAIRYIESINKSWDPPNTDDMIDAVEEIDSL